VVPTWLRLLLVVIVARRLYLAGMARVWADTYTQRAIRGSEPPPEAIKNPSEANQEALWALAEVSARQLCSGRSVVLEPSDQLGGGVVGGYLAGLAVGCCCQLGPDLVAY